MPNSTGTKDPDNKEIMVYYSSGWKKCKWRVNTGAEEKFH